MSLYRCGQLRNVETHIGGRNLLQSNDSSAIKIVRCVRMSQKVFEIGCGELDESLEEIPLFGAVPRCLPQSFEGFVRFPPIGEIVEVDSIAVVF